MQPTSLYGRGGPYGVDDRDAWVARRGIVSMESLAPPKPISREEPRACAAEHPSLSRTVRNRLSQAFSRFTLDPQPPPPPPIQQNGGDRGVWEYHTVTLARVSGYGFGIAVGGGKDSPNGGDPSIGISDVLKAGPAEGKLQINDRLVSANGISLENVDYTRAVQVLRECGNSVTLVIKRKVNSSTCSTHPQSVKVTLTKNKKKDDFGIVLGCKIYVKEIANQSNIDKDGTVQEGDIILKINSTSTDNMTLKEARKMIENSKEKLQLVLKRDTATNSSTSNGNDLSSPQPNSFDGSGDQNQWSQQNLYVQPPSRGDSNSKILPPPNDRSDDKNKFQSGRNRGPLMDISLSQLDQPATPLLTGHSHSRAPIGLDEDSIQRPPLPRIDEFSRNQFDDDPLARRNKSVQSEPRLISFQKEGSVGIRLTGGNEVGVFVTAVQPGSPASLQGLQPGDKLLKVNEMDMAGVTREEAVLFLLHIQDYVNLIVQHMKDDYDEIVANQKGDSFYIRTHFSYEGSGKGELEFHAGEIFHVINTLHNGVVGSWLVYRLGRSNQETQKGVIPNSQRAEQWMAEQQSQAKKDAASESRGSFFKRRSARRSKSLSKDHWEDVVFADGISKFPAYEKVTLKHPGFIRPVILFGALADVARDKLIKDYPDKYASPQLDGRLNDVPKSQKASGIIRLSAIKEIFDKGKHALLEITPSAVERLNYAQLWPVVVLLRLESKQLLKELRPRHRSSKKLLERANKIEKMWPHLFTSTITVTSADMWYKKLRETIDKQQQQAIWISETKPEAGISDDFLFPMPSRLSYASSPESDLEATSDGRLREGLVKASSDPSIAPEPSSAPPPAYDYGHRSRQLPYDFLQQADSLGSDLRDQVSPVKCNPGGETVKSSGGGQREPPPMVNRGTKPAHYRTAQERLFARHSLLIESGREQREPPDYINTGAQPHSLERPNGRLGGFDSSSYSSDSYNQYSSNPNDKNRAEPYSRPAHDPYRYARGVVQQQPQPPKPMNMDRGRMPPPTKYRHPDDRPAPPSPPPKPASYQHRLSDGRPVPPPKPGHYQSSRPWRGEDDLQPPHMPEPPPYTPNQRSRNSMDFIGSPPYYAPPTTDDSANRRYGKPPDDGGRGFAPWPATNGGGPYHNVPCVRGRRDPLFPPPYDHHAPPPSSGLIDLSNRENRGSAFELYKKPLHTMGGK